MTFPILFSLPHREVVVAVPAEDVTRRKKRIRWRDPR